MDRPDPNDLFKDHPGTTLAPPWEPFWDCDSFASCDCLGDCDHCKAPGADINLLC